MPQGIKRTSNLQAPTMQLTGHASEVFSLDFSPDGKSLASASFDKMVFLWRVFGDCDNYMVIKVRGAGRAWIQDGAAIAQQQPT